jgi:DNA-binding transcriptional ArsR family regulator
MLKEYDRYVADSDNLGGVMDIFELATLTDYSDDAVLEELRRVSAVLGTRRLTRKGFDKLGRVHSSTLTRKFGSWAKALDLAGISECQAPRPKVITREQIMDALRAHVYEFPDQSVTVDEIANRLGIDRTTISRKSGNWQECLAEVGLLPVSSGRRYTDNECFENILFLWTHYGRQPNFAELNQPPSKVGSKAYVGRWSGWRASLGAFIDFANGRETKSSEAKSLASNLETASDDFGKTPNESVSPRAVSLSLRYKVLVRDRFKCTICGRSPAKDLGVELHIDHIVPWSKGGLTIEENLRVLCFDCNLGKGAKMDEVC